MNPETNEDLEPPVLPPPPTMIICIDGSRLSHTAFKLGLALRTFSEKIIVYHVYDSQKPTKLL